MKFGHMNMIEPNEVVISRNRYLALIQLLSFPFQSKMSLVASLVSAAIASYFIRSIGIDSVGGMIGGVLFGFSIGTFIDSVRLRIRVAKALALISNRENES